MPQFHLGCGAFLVAWLKASTTASISNGTGQTSTVTTENGASSLGSFTVTFKAKAAPGKVKLTDGLGDTYVWDTSSNRKVIDNGNALAQVTMQMKIEYSGALNTANDVKALWAASVDPYTSWKIACEDATDYTSDTVPTGGNAPSAIKAAAGTTKKYGLKFGANNTTYDQGYVLNNEVTKVDLDVAAADLTTAKGKTFSGSNGTYSVDFFDITTPVYVGVWGIDGFEQKSGDTYTAKFTPKIAA